MTPTIQFDTIVFISDTYKENCQKTIYSQLAIMKYALSCTDEYYMVVEDNILFCHDLQMFDNTSKMPYIDMCNGDDSVYCDILNRLLPELQGSKAGSFNTGHMLICTDIMKSLILSIEENQMLDGADFVEKIINCCKELSSTHFNSYVLYGNYLFANYPSTYIIRKWKDFSQGSIFFKKDTIHIDDLTWLSMDYDSVSFYNNWGYIQEYSYLFHSHYYRKKLTPAQMLNAIFVDSTEKSTDLSTVGFHPENRLKYLSRDTYIEYEQLGDQLTRTNIDQAFLCYENALFLCDEKRTVSRIASKKQSLLDIGKIRINKTAFIIVSFNNLDFTIHCLESIYSNCNPESFLLMIFDNGSTDGSQEWLSNWGKEHEEAIVILNDSNLGFAGGNNACCKYLPDGYDIFYLNNDTRIPPNALFWMRMALYSSDDIGGVGAIQNYSKGDQLEDVYFDLPEQYVEYGAKHNIYEQDPYEEQSKLCGFAMLITREMYDITGGFDEQFNPGFLEDEDLSLQIRSYGKRLISCQNAFIYHAGSQSFRKRNDISDLFKINREKIIKKWGFDPTIYAAISENEFAFIHSLKKRGYDKNSKFTLVHIGCGCGNMLGHIHYLYPNAILAGIEKNAIAREYAISCISVFESVDALPMKLVQYDIIAKNLG